MSEINENENDELEAEYQRELSEANTLNAIQEDSRIKKILDLSDGYLMDAEGTAQGAYEVIRNIITRAEHNEISFEESLLIMIEVADVNLTACGLTRERILKLAKQD
ncbi:hypothetical protein AWB71_02564 [Caballeronia peredens]|nr:hypothetical protein AWB71_02564 [Caballeronia peredens]